LKAECVLEDLSPNLVRVVVGKVVDENGGDSVVALLLNAEVQMLALERSMLAFAVLLLARNSPETPEMGNN